MQADVTTQGRSQVAPGVPGEIDLRALGATLWRRKWRIILPTAFAAVAALVVVQFISPRYVSEARVLIEGRENIFLRPEAEKQTPERGALDPEAVTSQVQLVLSRDLARDVIRKLKLAERPEFDPVLRGVSSWKALLGVLGLVKDPFRMSAEERVLEAYYDRLSVFPVEKSRVVAISFQSGDPELAARVANAIAEGYLALQQAAKQAQARSASQWLSGEIETLRRTVAEAEAKVEQFRARANLFVGTNNTTLSSQQLAEINSQLGAARAQKSDAEARSRLIRDILKSGKALEISDVLNSELIRRLFEQRVAARAQLAEQSSTLLDAHPRIKELRAQIADFDRQMRQEADLLARSFENDARMASARVEGLAAGFDQLKRLAASNNEQDVQLRALERDAKSQRDLLESYLAKYREATARDTIDTAPADARIISRATVSNVPAYPKKLPIVLIAAFAMLALSSGLLVTQELLSPTAGPPQAASDDAASEATPGLLERIRRNKADTAAEAHPAVGVSFEAIAGLARGLREAGQDARRVTVVGSMPEVATALAALTLARALATDARVLLVDLAGAQSALAAISSDPGAPGLAALAAGMASFGQIITRDRFSPIHLIAAATPGADVDVESLLSSPRLLMTFDALARAYEHVVVDAGFAPDPVIARLAALAPRAVLVADGLTSPQTATARARLLAAGYSEVTVLVGARDGGEADAAGQGIQAA